MIPALLLVVRSAQLGICRCSDAKVHEGKWLPLAVGVVIGAGAVVLTYPYWSRLGAGYAEVEAGVVHSIDQDEIVALSYIADDVAVMALRGRADEGFSVTVARSDGGSPTRCTASRDMSGLLPALAEVRATRILPADAISREYPVAIGKVELEDRIVGEDFPPLFLFATRDGKSLAGRQDSTAFETDLGAEILARLEGLCAGMLGGS